MTRVFYVTLLLIPLLLFLFIVFTFSGINNQVIFYTVKLISVIPAFAVTAVILRKKLPFASLVANGLICTMAGTCITVLMIILGNYGIRSLFTNGYPLFFIRLGLLGDMIFYHLALLKKWQFKEKELVVEKIKSQLEIEKLRNKISGELHDDIGSTLSGISMYSYMMNNFLVIGKIEEARHSADIILKSAGEITNRLSDIVWVVNPDRDSLLKLFDRLEEYAKDMASFHKIEVQTNIPETITALTLEMEVRRNIYLFCKEAINNAVKYSKATLLCLTIKEKRKAS